MIDRKRINDITYRVRKLRLQSPEMFRDGSTAESMAFLCDQVARLLDRSESLSNALRAAAKGTGPSCTSCRAGGNSAKKR